MELNEKDIKVLASSRFIRKTRKKFLVWVIVCFAVLSGTLFFANIVPKYWNLLLLVPSVTLVVILLWKQSKGEKKAQEELLKEWKEGKGDTSS